nr:unnamed protein product [Digitaria exilis]
MAHGVAGAEVAPQCGVEDLTCRRAASTDVPHVDRAAQGPRRRPASSTHACPAAACDEHACGARVTHR